MLSNFSRLIPLLVFIGLLNGCATYKQDMNTSLDLAKQGDWKGAEAIADDVLDAKQDHLLKLMETGAMAQYQGDFTRSNVLLEEADKISDSFLKEDSANRAFALLTNPRQGDFRASGLESVYINFYKSLNYLALAQQAESKRDRQNLLDAALVEARRIELKLNEINALTPSYEDIDGKNQSFYQKALTWLSGFYTGGINADDFVYRDDAWARYLEGLQYEMSGEYDDARIAYQKAAETYDAGYSKQYRLPSDASQRAWLDTIRMMQKAGGWKSEIPVFIKDKLTPKYQTLLSTYDKQNAELVVLEGQGFVPAKKELNLMLYAVPNAYSLVLRPVYTGSNIDANNAARWFSMVYADTNVLNMFANYQAGGIWSSVNGIFTKRVILGRGLWSQLQNLGADEMLLGMPVRVAIPYYDPFRLTDKKGSLVNAGTSGTESIRMSSLADIAIQEQLAQAHQDIYEALIRELVRSLLAYQVTNQINKQIDDPALNLLASLVGKVAVTASVASETRNWLTLPAQVRIVRQPVAAGTQSFTYQSQGQTFNLDNVDIKENEVKLWRIRNPN